MADGRFVSLAELVRSAAQNPSAALWKTTAPDAEFIGADFAPVRDDAAATVEPLEPAPQPTAGSRPTEVEPDGKTAAPSGLNVMRDVRIFRAALADALDVLCAGLVRDLGRDVLGREVLLAPVEIEVVARRLVADCWADEPLRLRVAAADAGFACDVPVHVDPTLERGDAVLECRAGAIDARLCVRLADVVAALGAT